MPLTTHTHVFGKSLRTVLVDANITPILLPLLNDPAPNVQEYAIATLCNIVLDFSPLKTLVIDGGGLEILNNIINLNSTLLDEEHDSNNNSKLLLLNSMWAIKNLLYQADGVIKRRVMQSLTFDTLYRLSMTTKHDDVKVQAMYIWRNLACASATDVAFVLDGLDTPARFLDLVHDALLHARDSSDEDLLTQVLYLLVNCSTSTRPADIDMMLSDAGIMDAIRLNLASTYALLSNPIQLIEPCFECCEDRGSLDRDQSHLAAYIDHDDDRLHHDGDGQAPSMPKAPGSRYRAAAPGHGRGEQRG